jgi:hypothetical protein
MATSSSGGVDVKDVPLLTPDNYHVWRSDFRAYTIIKRVHHVMKYADNGLLGTGNSSTSISFMVSTPSLPPDNDDETADQPPSTSTVSSNKKKTKTCAENSNRG